MKTKSAIWIFIAVLTGLILVFSCDDTGDERKNARSSLGEPDILIPESYGNFETEYWVYAQRDINRVYEFRRTTGGCGGSGQWYLYSQYLANGSYYYNYTLYDHPPVITHIPVTTATPGSPVTVAATIMLSDIAKEDDYITGARLYYRPVGDSLYTMATMQFTPPNDSVFYATIPEDVVSPNGAEYYIEACSNEVLTVSFYWSRLPEEDDLVFTVKPTATDAPAAKRIPSPVSNDDGPARLPRFHESQTSLSPMGS